MSSRTRRYQGKWSKLQIWVQALTFASVCFLAYYLVRQDHVSLKDATWSPWLMAASILVLCTAVTVGALTWAATLRLHGANVPVRTAVSSHGLSAFAKFIPGKVWTVLGRASRIGVAGIPLGKASMLSLKAQLTNIWTGLALGIVPTLLLADLSAAGWVALGFVAFGVPFLFIPKLQTLVDRILQCLTRGRLSLPTLSAKRTVLFVLPFVALWALYILAFGLFVRSLQPDASLQAAFAFPLAMNIGLLAIVLPGGLGVREGVMTGLLAMSGIPIGDAASIALLARLWFTLGEGFIFLVAVVLRWRGTRRTQDVRHAEASIATHQTKDTDGCGQCDL